MFKKVAFAFLIIAWCVNIFILSSMSVVDSGNKSKEIIKKGVIIVCEISYKSGLINHMPSEEWINNFATEWNTPFRKISHALVYFVLATILMFAIRKTTKITLLNAGFITVLASFAYSITDEIHQRIIGRGGSFSDCLIDTAGAIIAVLIYLLAKWISLKCNKRRT